MIGTIVEILSGPGAGQRGLVGRRFGVGPDWQADVTLLDLPDTAQVVKLALRLVPQPSLVALSGDDLRCKGRSVAQGEILPLPAAGLTLTVGAADILVRRRTVKEWIDAVIGSGRAGRKAGAAAKRRGMFPAKRGALLAVPVILGTMGIILVPGGDGTGQVAAPSPSAPAHPAPREATGPTKASILVRAMADGVQPGPGMTLDIDPVTKVVTLVATGTDGEAKRRADAFERWYDTQPDLPPVRRRVVVAEAPARRTDYPDISMVLSARDDAAPTVVTTQGRSIRAGEKLASGWQYEGMKDGLLIFVWGTETIRVRPDF